MKKIFVVLLVMIAFVWAKTPIQLVEEGACFWPAETDKETGEVILKKGCPRYYTEKSQGCSVKFSAQNLEEDGETLHILIADWNVIEYKKDEKHKFKGTTKFVVDIRDGEEGLFPYEIKVDCKGGSCKLLEQTVISTITQVASALNVYDLSGMAGLWNRTFSIDKESALYYVNHDVVKALMLQALFGARTNITLDAMDPMYFNILMVVSRGECPSLTEKKD